MKTKVTMLLVAILLCLSNSFAEEKSEIGDLAKSHYVNLSIGDATIASLIYGTRSLFFSYNYEPPYHTYDLFAPDYKLGPKYTTGSITASYYYRFKSWFWVGGNLSYTGFTQNYYDAFSIEHLGRNTNHVITLLPTVRFSYLNKQYVTLYSEIALGITYNYQRQYGKTVESQVLPAWQTTLIGVSAGKDLYGFAELGSGLRGIAIIGIGYRFPHAITKKTEE